MLKIFTQGRRKVTRTFATFNDLIILEKCNQCQSY